MARKIKKAFQIMSFSKMLKPMASFTISFSKNVRYL
ncbi:hypothetical protein EGH56_11860 [Klebsiella aerogenes]|nr:hypothetical protein EGH56_11860 [Klebsiella aerogenes]